MNAGLLGEHLASPRTAQKTNQSTALETKPAERGESSSKDEFASLVKEEPQAAPEKNPVKEPAGSDDTISLPATASDVLDPAEIKFFETELATGAVDLPETEVAAETPKLTPVAVGEEAVAEIRTAEPKVTAEAAIDPRLQEVDAVEPELKLGKQVITNPEQALADQQARQTQAQTPQISSAQSALEAGAVEAGDVDLPRAAPQVADAEAAVKASSVATPQLAANEAITAVNTDVKAVPETLTTLGPSQSAAPSGTVQLATGMAPTAPATMIAAPNELTNIVLNALKNGATPQEQLVVQLDPPELGRVMIDFKFDAQGLQQITVTAENPEALKRLREMHVELTEALKQQGLSDGNMSFQQEAEDRSHQAWQSDTNGQSDRQFAALGERTEPRPTPSSDNRLAANDRLNLVL